MAHASEAHRWVDQLDDLVARIAPRFNRTEPRRARDNLQGLFSPLERKNGWHLAEAAGDASPDGVQDFLARMHWDADAVRDDLCAYVVEHLGADLAPIPSCRAARLGGREGRSSMLSRKNVKRSNVRSPDHDAEDMSVRPWFSAEQPQATVLSQCYPVAS